MSVYEAYFYFASSSSSFLLALCSLQTHVFYWAYGHTVYEAKNMASIVHAIVLYSRTIRTHRITEYMRTHTQLHAFNSLCTPTIDTTVDWTHNIQHEHTYMQKILSHTATDRHIHADPNSIDTLLTLLQKLLELNPTKHWNGKCNSKKKKKFFCWIESPPFKLFASAIYFFISFADLA